MKSVMPKDLTIGSRIQFDTEVGTVVANNPAKPSTKYDLNSRIVEVAFAGKSNLEIRLKGSDAMNVIE